MFFYKRGENEGEGLWSKCGVMLKKNNGKQSIKFDVMPVSTEWDGWLVVSARIPKVYGQDGRTEVSVFEEPPF